MTTTELNRLSAVEGSMVFHSVKHSHSYISQACAIDVIKKCFSDSSTAKNVTCDKTKVIFSKLNHSYNGSHLSFRLEK